MSAPISDETLENFCTITGCNQDRAKFFIEASNGSLDVSCFNQYFHNN